MPRRMINLREVSFHANPYFRITDVAVPVARITKITVTEMQGEGYEHIKSTLQLGKDELMFVTQTRDEITNLINEA